MEENMTYSQAMKKLEAIVAKIENGELDIDSLSESLKEAQTLIKLCRDRLYRTDEEIKKMLDDSAAEQSVTPIS